MNNNKLLSFLYLTTSEANFVQFKEKKSIKFNISKYNMAVVLTDLSDDKLELNFIVKTSDNFNEDPTKGDKKIVDLELVKPFIIDSYAQHNLEVNEKVIEEVGLEQYQQWLERDLQILKNPYEVNSIDNVKIDDMKYSHDDRQMINFENTQTQLNENIQIINSDKTLEQIGFLEVLCSHFIIGKTNENTPKYTTCYIKYKIPMLELEKYPFLYQDYQLPAQEDIFASITGKNTNKDLDNILQYLKLSEGLENKATIEKKKKI